jgi:hypothetical protein
MLDKGFTTELQSQPLIRSFKFLKGPGSFPGYNNLPL